MDLSKIIALFTALVDLLKALLAKQTEKTAKAQAMSPDDVKAALEQILAVAQFVVQLTPSTLDDKIVAFIVAAKDNPTMLALITWIVNLFAKDPAAAMAKLEALAKQEGVV